MLKSKRQNTERKHVIDLTPVLQNFQFTKMRLLLQSPKIRFFLNSSHHNNSCFVFKNWFIWKITTTTHFPDLYRSSFNTPPTFLPQNTKRVTVPKEEFSPGSSLSEPLQLSAASLIVSGHCADLTNAAWLLLQFFFKISMKSRQGSVWPPLGGSHSLCGPCSFTCQRKHLCRGQPRALCWCVCVWGGCRWTRPCVSSWNINSSQPPWRWTVELECDPAWHDITAALNRAGAESPPTNPHLTTATSECCCRWCAAIQQEAQAMERAGGQQLSKSLAGH